MRAPNEKLIETLFVYNALRFLDGSGATVYTPSTREEYVAGYDAKLMGAGAFDELYVQFKTPRLLMEGGYGFSTTEHQHWRLRRYPRGTAFYVTHIFNAVSRIQQAQREAATPADFLRWYLAIEINRLEDDVRWFRYYATTEFCEVHEVRYTRGVDGSVRYPRHDVHSPNGWMTGDELLRRFKTGAVGARVVLADSFQKETIAAGVEGTGREDDEAFTTELELYGAEGSERTWRRGFIMSPQRAGEMVLADEGSDWGTMLRKRAK